MSLNLNTFIKSLLFRVRCWYGLIFVSIDWRDVRVVVIDNSNIPKIHIKDYTHIDVIRRVAESLPCLVTLYLTKVQWFWPHSVQMAEFWHCFECELNNRLKDAQCIACFSTNFAEYQECLKCASINLYQNTQCINCFNISKSQTTKQNSNPYP